MKINVLDQHGKKAKEITSMVFDSEIRQDIMQKIIEAEKMNSMQEWAPYFLAGKEVSAHGKVKHTRHVWKSDRGKGLARIPKKQLSRKGDRFVWVGAFIPGTRGGRRAHPPKIGERLRKINKKELIFGLKSALALVSSGEMVRNKYSRLENKKIGLKLPVVIEEKVIGLGTKEFFGAMEKILGEFYPVAVQKKSIRAGKGKMRGRKYKKNAGALLVIGNKEEKKIKGIDVVKAKELKLGDLASNGARICIFSENAIKDIEGRLGCRGKI